MATPCDTEQSYPPVHIQIWAAIYVNDIFLKKWNKHKIYQKIFLYTSDNSIQLRKSLSTVQQAE